MTPSILSRHRILLPLGASALALAVTAGVAWAHWSATGTGTAAAAAATLDPPAAVSATAPAWTGAVSLTWTAASLSTGQAASGYVVARLGGSGPAAACGTSAASPTTATSCTDGPVPDGTYHYVVTAVYRTWTASSAPSDPVTVLTDSVPPAVPAPGVSAAVVSGGNPVFVSSEAVTLTDAATDAGSGVASVSYYYCTGSTGSCTSGNWTPLGTATGPAGSYPASTGAFRTLADGPYRILAVATDHAGNASGASAATAIAVDTAPPTVSRPTVNGHH